MKNHDISSIPWLILPILLWSSACSDTIEAEEEEPFGGSFITSELLRDTSPQLESGELEELVAGNTAFAIDLYRNLAAEGDGNLFTSPHSITLALAMTYVGASGNTADEMAEVLRFTLEDSRLHNAFNALELALSSRGSDVDGGFRLHIVNAIWGRTGYDFLEGFLDTIAVNYGAGLRLLDFIGDSEGARKTINDWVAYHTQAKIKDLLPEGSITPSVVMVLTNAIYFYGDWVFQFEKHDTRPRDFHLSNHSTIQVDMMHQIEMLRYAETADYQAVELPYVGNELSMVIVLPDSLSSFEEVLDGALLAEIQGSLTATSLELAIPKFEFEFEVRLRDALVSMGMVDAFGAADFSGINGGFDLVIDQVYHKAYVRVDEEGTEAAAATAVVVRETSAPVGEHSMIVDSPFFFYIRDNETGAILFMGRITDPNG